MTKKMQSDNTEFNAEAIKRRHAYLVATKTYYTGVMVVLEGIKQLKRQLKIAEEKREILNKEGLSFK